MGSKEGEEGDCCSNFCPVKRYGRYSRSAIPPTLPAVAEKGNWGGGGGGGQEGEE